MDNRSAEEILANIRKIHSEIEVAIGNIVITTRKSIVMEAIEQIRAERENQNKMGVL